MLPHSQVGGFNIEPCRAYGGNRYAKPKQAQKAFQPQKATTAYCCLVKILKPPPPHKEKKNAF